MAKSWKIASFVVVLLVLMALSHYVTGTTPEELSANKHPTPTANAAKGASHSGDHGKPVPLPHDIGPATAVVKVKVYVTSDNTCDTSTVQGMKDIAGKYPGKVLIQFMDLKTTEAAKEAETAKISCKSGLTINGMSILRIPGRGVNGLVMFDGPMGEKNYSLEDVDAAVKYLVSKQPAKGKKSDQSR